MEMLIQQQLSKLILMVELLELLLLSLGSGAIASLLEDTTPQLGGDLDLNGNDITGTGNINITGVVTATSFHTGAEGSAIRVTSNTISGPAEMFIDPSL